MSKPSDDLAAAERIYANAVPVDMRRMYARCYVEGFAAAREAAIKGCRLVAKETGDQTGRDDYIAAIRALAPEVKP